MLGARNVSDGDQGIMLIEEWCNLCSGKKLGQHNEKGIRFAKQATSCMNVFLLIMMPTTSVALLAGGIAGIDIYRHTPDNYLGIGFCSTLAVFGVAGLAFTAIKGVKYVCALRKQKNDRQNLMANADQNL